MKKLQTPPFLNNLYRDMRDRRLLVPALALIVGLIAVPLALSSSSATTAPPPVPPSAASSGSGHEAATSPAVLTEQLGVTNYRERLEQIKSKNPFRLHFTGQPQDARSDTSSSGGAPSTSAATGSSTAIPPTTSSGSTTATSETPFTSPSDTPTSTAAPRPPKPPKPTVYAFRVNVAVGPPGDVTRRKDVEQGKFLPGEAKPMVAFIGASENMKHALFLISDDVSSVSGDGRCLPGRNDCRLLKLKVGDEAQLAYAPEGDRTYKLKLLGIDLAAIKAKAGAKQGTPASLSALVSGR
jgi:hypothetical protein